MYEVVVYPHSGHAYDDAYQESMLLDHNYFPFPLRECRRTISPITHPTCVQNTNPNFDESGLSSDAVLGAGTEAPGPYAACPTVWGAAVGTVVVWGAKNIEE